MHRVEHYLFPTSISVCKAEIATSPSFYLLVSLCFQALQCQETFLLVHHQVWQLSNMFRPMNCKSRAVPAACTGTEKNIFFFICTGAHSFWKPERSTAVSWAEAKFSASTEQGEAWTSGIHPGRVLCGIFNARAQMLNGRFVYRRVVQEMLGLCSTAALFSSRWHTWWLIYLLELLSSSRLLSGHSCAPAAVEQWLKLFTQFAAPAKTVPGTCCCAQLHEQGMKREHSSTKNEEES